MLIALKIVATIKTDLMNNMLPNIPQFVIRERFLKELHRTKLKIGHHKLLISRLNFSNKPESLKVQVDLPLCTSSSCLGNEYLKSLLKIETLTLGVAK